MNIFSGAAKMLGKAVKSAWNSRIGKVIIVAAAIYTGAALISGATTAAGVMSTIAASPTAVGASIGALIGASTGKDENILAGAAIGGLAGYGYGAMTETAGTTAPDLLASTTPSTSGVPTSAGIDATLSNASGIEGGVNLGSNAGAGYSGAGYSGAGYSGGGEIVGDVAAKSWAAENPMLAYGAMQAGGSVISGYAQGEAQKAADEEAAKREQTRIDAENARIAATQYRRAPGYKPLTPNLNFGITPQTLAPQPIALLPPVPGA